MINQQPITAEYVKDILHVKYLNVQFFSRRQITYYRFCVEVKEQRAYVFVTASF
jgi:hypothetical protein